jgi:hypothetical protein
MSFQAVELLVAAAGMDIEYCGRRSVEAVPTLVVNIVLLLVSSSGGRAAPRTAPETEEAPSGAAASHITGDRRGFIQDFRASSRRKMLPRRMPRLLQPELEKAPSSAHSDVYLDVFDVKVRKPRMCTWMCS